MLVKLAKELKIQKQLKEQLRSPSIPTTGVQEKQFDCILPDSKKTYVYVSGWTKQVQNCQP